MRTTEIHLIDCGAVDPTGVVSSAAAFNTALLRAEFRDAQVILPAGTIKIDPDTEFRFCEIKGVPGRTTLIPSGSGTRLLVATNVSRIVDVILDGQELVEDGVYVPTHVGFKNVEVKNVTRYGIHVRLGLCTIDAYTHDCGSHGLFLSSANGTFVERIVSKNNGGWGLFADGAFVEDPEFDDTSGGVFIHFAVLENNAAGAISYDGVQGGHIKHTAAIGNGDCIFQDDSHNVTYRNIMMIGGDAPYRFARFVGTSRTQFLTCTHNKNDSAGPSGDYFAVRLEGSSISGIVKENCKYISRVASTDMPNEIT